MTKKSIERMAAEEALGLINDQPPVEQPSVPFKSEHLAVILGQCNMSLDRARAHIIVEHRKELIK